MARTHTKATVFFAILAIVARVVFYVTTPIWLDYFNPYTNGTSNHSNDDNNSFPQNKTHRINVIFLVVGQWSFSCIVFGLALLGTLLVAPWMITENDRQYPKRNFFIIGFSQGISSLMINFAVSGQRTAPYLQALLSNFGIPIQFVMRFIVLRQKPTWLKTVCACAVVISEFVSLMPTIFQLDSSTERDKEGGAQGAGRILWPLLMVMSLVPFTFANTIMEKSVQDDTRRASSTENEGAAGPGVSTRRTRADVSQVNLVYFLFWWTFFNSLTVAAFFWLDLIPGFGTSSNIHNFLDQLLFNARCLFGQAGCGMTVVSLGWVNFVGNLLGALAFAGLMRYSEGASFVVIVLALRTPIVFLFWTLFIEHPFSWGPHLALSTWLSIAAIFVMFPAVIIYNSGLPSISKCFPWCCKSAREEEGTQSLIEEPSRNVNTASSDDDIVTFRK